MGEYFNSLGRQTVTGTSFQDRFFAFTRSINPNDVRPDAVLSSLVWTTAIKMADGSNYVFSIPNVQISTDVILGGDKSDFLYGSNLNDAIVYNNGTFGDGLGGFDSIEQFYLGAGDDFIDLSAHGPGGIDYEKDAIIRAEDGNDIIVGGAGNDTIEGNNGNDLIFGYRRADQISGGAGDDTIYGDDLGYNGIAGDDVLRGQAGNDTLYGGGRSDRLEGGDNDDQLYGGLGGDNLFGDAGIDTLYGEDGNDMLEGGSGNDLLYGGSGGDEMRGSAGNDWLDGGDGSDFVFGGLNNDTLLASAGNDTIDGGADFDTVVFSGKSDEYNFTLNSDGSYTITDARTGSPDGGDVVRNVEAFQFTDKTLTSNDLALII